jgi:hypothetical protein
MTVWERISNILQKKNRSKVYNVEEGMTEDIITGFKKLYEHDENRMTGYIRNLVEDTMKYLIDKKDVMMNLRPFKLPRVERRTYMGLVRERYLC